MTADSFNVEITSASGKSGAGELDTGALKNAGELSDGHELARDANAEAEIAFGAELLRNADESLRREWLVTNGLGGYASASLATANTRRYHGLLVAALNPPVGRAVLLSKLEETLTVTDAQGSATAYALSANVYPGAIYPQGYQHLESWSAYPTPTWTWQPTPGLRFEKRVWMAQGENTTYIAYRLLDAPENTTVRLSLVPLLAWRDYHSEMAAGDFHPNATWLASESASELQLLLPPIARVTPIPTALRLRLLNADSEPVPAAHFDPHPDWYYHLQHPREQERGQDFQEDLYAPGTLSLPLAPGQTVVVVASAEEQGTGEKEKRRKGEKEKTEETQSAIENRQSAMPSSFILHPSTFAKQLTLAADQFIVQVPGVRSTIIAGYPWFGDWGRDTMISLPGLCLTTGKTDIAREILLSFAQYVDAGMLPNRFPDVGETPEYNTVDATLWYFVAIYRYVEATGDFGLLSSGLWETLKQIVHWHQQGTRYNIHVDPADSLLYAGQDGVQLTWMDAKVGDWVVTPRIGKPVEINALWVNALRIMAHFANLLNDSAADSYTQQAQQTQASFLARFAREDGRGLYDVLEDAEGTGNREQGTEEKTEELQSKIENRKSAIPSSLSVRPNQIFALSLPFPIVEPNSALATAIINVVREELLTPCGLRTLSPHDPDFKPRYEGNAWHRDGAYHQGTVWPWLLGPFAEAYAKVTGDVEGAKQMLSGLQTQLTTFGIGSLAEIFDGSEPQRPNGCYAQAWSIAETLRVWQQLTTS